MNYHDIKKIDMLNGSGLRVVLFVSGCSHYCEDCQNSITWDANGGILFDENAMQEIKDAHNLKSNLLNIDKESLKCQYNEDISNEEFKTLYMLQPFQIGKTFKNGKRENRKERCGECSFFGDKGCTTSYLEAKHGNKNTPACSEFSPMILGTKATMIIIDDPIKKGEEIKTSSPFSY